MEKGQFYLVCARSNAHANKLTIDQTVLIATLICFAADANDSQKNADHPHYRINSFLKRIKDEIKFNDHLEGVSNFQVDVYDKEGKQMIDIYMKDKQCTFLTVTETEM